MDAVEKLMDMLCVHDNLEKVSYQEYFKALNDVETELADYVSREMGSEPYYFKLYLPTKKVEAAQITSGSALELIHFPFGVFSLNVWNKFGVSDENPIYRLLRYLDFETRGIRTYLSVRNVDSHAVMTTEMLNEHGILDIFSLHSFENIYSDATKYFRLATEI